MPADLEKPAAAKIGTITEGKPFEIAEIEPMNRPRVTSYHAPVGLHFTACPLSLLTPADSADEASLYDRQIRLWGLDAQNRYGIPLLPRI